MTLVDKVRNKLMNLCIHYGPESLRMKILRKKCCHIGENTRLYATTYGAEPYLLWIGNNVIVASGASLIEHDASYYNAYRFLEEKPIYEGEKMGGIVIHDNCFIGSGAIVLGGTEIGANSIIAAGAVVSGKIPPNEVWGGVPAHFIMTTDQYAKRVKEKTENLPWIQNQKYKSLNSRELMMQKQKYYLSSVLDKKKIINNSAYDVLNGLC